MDCCLIIQPANAPSIAPRRRKLKDISAVPFSSKSMPVRSAPLVITDPNGSCPISGAEGLSKKPMNTPIAAPMKIGIFVLSPVVEVRDS